MKTGAVQPSLTRRSTLCNFGAVPVGASVTLTIVAQLARLWKEDGPKAFVLIGVQFKEHPADLQMTLTDLTREIG